jgi:hypothetical protein
MTLTEHLKLIGTQGAWRYSPDCSITVNVRDVRSAYGRTDLLVEPVEGFGSTWVKRENVEVGLDHLTLEQAIELAK